MGCGCCYSVGFVSKKEWRAHELAYSDNLLATADLTMDSFEYDSPDSDNGKWQYSE